MAIPLARQRRQIMAKLLKRRRRKRMHRRLTRRRLLLAGGTGLAALVGGAAYTRWVEPYWVREEHVHVPFGASQRPPVGLRVALLADLHRSTIVPDTYLRQAVDLANSLEPHLVVLGGDYFTGAASWANGLADVLRGLHAPLGVFAVLGNHDGGRWAQRHHGPATTQAIGGELVRAGAELLVNASRTLSFNGTEFQIVGLGDLWARQFRPRRAFEHVRADRFVIVASHNPDTIEPLADYPGDLLLCGHTHGGQVHIPLLGPPYAPVRDKRFLEGLHHLRRRYVYITRGVGLIVQWRFNCRPEVSLLEITEKG